MYHLPLTPPSPRPRTLFQSFPGCIAGRIDRLIYRLNQLPEKGTQVLAELAALKPHIQEAYDRMLDFRPRDMADEIKKPKVTGGMLWSHVTDETERLHRLRRLHPKKQQGLG